MARPDGFKMGGVAQSTRGVDSLNLHPRLVIGSLARRCCRVVLVRQRVNGTPNRFFDRSFLMKALPIVGVLLLVLGVLSFVVPVPHRENHGVKIGDAKISVETESSDKLPPAAGILLLAGGVVALVLGLRKT